jgi:polar amino acid transport system permease protein
LNTGYQWDFDIVLKSLGLLGNGLLTSIELTALTCLLGTVIAVPIAIAFRHPLPFIRHAAIAFVEIGKGVPLLALLIWFHLAIPIWTGLSTNAFWNAVAAFTISLAAFLADILRGGIAAIPVGHIEAARALGFNGFTVLRRIVIPETIRRSLPAASAMYITAFKLSTLASAIGVPDLLFNVRLINSQDPHPMELYTALTLIFLAVVIPASHLSRRLETHPWFAIAPINEN